LRCATGPGLGLDPCFLDSRLTRGWLPGCPRRRRTPRTIEALEFTIDPERKLIPRLDALRRKRNTGAYDDYGVVSQGEADLAGKLAAEVRKVVEDWIRKNHAEKIS